MRVGNKYVRFERVLNASEHNTDNFKKRFLCLFLCLSNLITVYRSVLNSKC